MAHWNNRSGYARLVERLNRSPQGAPPSKLLYKILKMLFSEKEAELVALLPLKFFTAEKAARIWKMDTASAESILDLLAGRAILVDLLQNDNKVYLLPPPMAGFFEFSMMRTRGDLDQKLLSELYYQYINEEDDFIKDLFGLGETKLGRVFVQEPSLPPDNSFLILDYERASEVIKSATHRGVSLCYCRHKMQHVGRDCEAPKDICLTFNIAASSLIRSGFARPAEVSECLDLLSVAYESNLVQFGENVRQGVNFICNCCGCCCEGMLAAKKIGMLNPVHTTNFMPAIDNQACNGCGKCVSVCPVDAVHMMQIEHSERATAAVEENNCLGCGICARNCPQDAITLIQRKTRTLTPLNTAHRFIIMAIERGCLQEFIFDNNILLSHRALAVLLGVILKLPPFKQVLAMKQLKSRYLEFLIERLDLTGAGAGLNKT